MRFTVTRRNVRTTCRFVRAWHSIDASVRVLTGERDRLPERESALLALPSIAHCDAAHFVEHMNMAHVLVDGRSSLVRSIHGIL